MIHTRSILVDNDQFFWLLSLKKKNFQNYFIFYSIYWIGIVLSAFLQTVDANVYGKSKLSDSFFKPWNHALFKKSDLSSVIFVREKWSYSKKDLFSIRSSFINIDSF